MAVTRPQSSRARTFLPVRSRVGHDLNMAGARDAMLAQFEATYALVARLSDEQANLPTRLAPWRVVELVTHISGSLDFVLLALRTQAEAGTAVSPLHWDDQI